jgi:hypothetical protein
VVTSCKHARKIEGEIDREKDMVSLIDMAQVRDQWRALVNAVMNPRFP